MATYNGERYLEEQLNSIIRQTRLPDEIIICDDCSNDNTISIAKRFSSSAQFKVEIHQNLKNLGFIKNFEKAISLAKGDILILCDQDDVWEKNKIQDIEDYFFKNQEYGGVFSDAEVVNEKLESVGYNLWECVKFSERQQKCFIGGNSFNLLINRNVVTGATLAFRSTMIKYFMPIPANCAHDLWIALIISIVSRIGIINKPLIKYRQHSMNQIGIMKENIIEKIIRTTNEDSKYFIKIIERYTVLVSHLKKHQLANEKIISSIEKKINHLRLRSCLPERKIERLPKIFLELIKGSYRHYSNGWKSAAIDILR